MADTYAFGIASNSISTISGSVVETYEVGATGTEKILTGNNEGQTPVDARYSEKKQTVHVVFEFTSTASPSMPMDLLGTSFASGVTSDNTTASTLSVTGIVSDAKLIAHKGDWWQYDLTILETS